MLRPTRLRSGRASFPASGSSKPCWLVGGQKRRVAVLEAAGGCETVFTLVRVGRPRRGDRDSRADGREPPLALIWGLWPMVDGEQSGGGPATAVLGSVELQGGVVDIPAW